MASDPLFARERIKQLNPDVLTLDVEMPRMDGLTFLSNLMRLRPMPVVMISSLTEAGAQTTLRALELGAVDFVSKPKADLSGTLREFAEEICNKVRAAAQARVRARTEQPTPAAVPPKYSADAVIPAAAARTDCIPPNASSPSAPPPAVPRRFAWCCRRMPADSPAVLIAQHIPAAFSGAFTQRMNSLSSMSVCEPRDGQQIVPGHVYIAPGDRHLMLVRDGARYLCSLSDGPHVNRHRPSVDVLFRSVAQNAGRNAVGAILTGMGDDGARGHEGDARSRCPDSGAGRGHQRRLGHAGRGGKARRCTGSSASGAHRRSGAAPRGRQFRHGRFGRQARGNRMTALTPQPTRFESSRNT